MRGLLVVGFVESMIRERSDGNDEMTHVCTARKRKSVLRSKPLQHMYNICVDNEAESRDET